MIALRLKFAARQTLAGLALRRRQCVSTREALLRACATHHDTIAASSRMMEVAFSALRPISAVSRALAVHVMHAAPCSRAQASIQESLTYYICQRLQTARWQHVHFELSGATVQVGLLHAPSRVL